VSAQGSEGATSPLAGSTAPIDPSDTAAEIATRNAKRARQTLICPPSRCGPSSGHERFTLGRSGWAERPKGCEAVNPAHYALLGLDQAVEVLAGELPCVGAQITLGGYLVAGFTRARSTRCGTGPVSPTASRPLPGQAAALGSQATLVAELTESQLAI
jgi:hypothetical protein